MKHSIWGTQCSSQRMYYFGGAEEKHPPTTAEFQVRFTAAKLPVLQTQLAVFISGEGSCPCQFGDSMCIRGGTLWSTPLSHKPQGVSSNRDPGTL